MLHSVDNGCRFIENDCRCEKLYKKGSEGPQIDRCIEQQAPMFPSLPQYGQQYPGHPNPYQIPWEPGQPMNYQGEQSVWDPAMPPIMNNHSMNTKHIWAEPGMSGSINEETPLPNSMQQHPSTRGCCSKNQQISQYNHAHSGQAMVSKNPVYDNTSASYENQQYRTHTGSIPGRALNSHEQDSNTFHINPLTSESNHPYLRNGNPFSPYSPQPFDQENSVDSANLSYHGHGIVGSAMPFSKSDIRKDEATLACLCGPGCQCVACASHPFNAATQTRVEELTNIMDENGDFASNEAIRGQTLIGNEFEDGSYLQAVPLLLDPPDIDSTMTRSGFDAIRFGGYHNLQYNIGSGCGAGGCRCGEGCQCRGCITHRGHNGP